MSGSTYSGTDLKRRTLHAVGWALVRIGGTNVLGFVVFAALARVLSPHDFGLFALAMLMVEVARIISSAGLSDAITRDRENDELLADTAFWANIAFGSVVGLVAWLLAPFYAATIDEPSITPILRSLAALVPLASLSSIHTARKLREFGHKAIAARTVTCGAIGGGCAIVAALAGYGVWSLVIQTFVVDVVGIMFAWASYRWLPRFRFDLRRLCAVWGFSATMMLTQILGLMLTRVQDLVIARFISVSAVGSYRIAWRMIDLILQTTLQPIVSVSFVTFSHLQGDRVRFRRAYLRMLELGALLTFPAITGFAILAEDIIATLFGPQWIASAGIARILALMMIPICMNYFLFPALASIGRSVTIAKSSLLQTAATLVLSLLAAPFGVKWIAAAYVLRTYLTMPYHLRLFRQDTGITLNSMVRAISPPFLASVAMATALFAMQHPLHHAVGRGIAYVALSVLLGCVAFAGALLLFAGDYLRDHLAALRAIVRGRSEEAPAA
jgi:O-antigen/teichoic acid export membrane protein